MQDGHSLLVLLADGGPDFNVNRVVNEMYYGHLFKQCKLDALLVTSYCPGHSALNPVERLWSPCTRALTSVSIPANLPRELPPCQQRQLSTDERVAKKKTVFNNAISPVSTTTGRIPNMPINVLLCLPYQVGQMKDHSQILDRYMLQCRHQLQGCERTAQCMTWGRREGALQVSIRS